MNSLIFQIIGSPLTIYFTNFGKTIAIPKILQESGLSPIVVLFNNSKQVIASLSPSVTYWDFNDLIKNYQTIGNRLLILDDPYDDSLIAAITLIYENLPIRLLVLTSRDTEHIASFFSSTPSLIIVNPERKLKGALLEFPLNYNYSFHATDIATELYRTFSLIWDPSTIAVIVLPDIETLSNFSDILRDRTKVGETFNVQVLSSDTYTEEYVKKKKGTLYLTLDFISVKGADVVVTTNVIKRWLQTPGGGSRLNISPEYEPSFSSKINHYLMSAATVISYHGNFPSYLTSSSDNKVCGLGRIIAPRMIIEKGYSNDLFNLGPLAFRLLSEGMNHTLCYFLDRTYGSELLFPEPERDESRFRLRLKINDILAQIPREKDTFRSFLRLASRACEGDSYALALLDKTYVDDLRNFYSIYSEMELDNFIERFKSIVSPAEQTTIDIAIGIISEDTIPDDSPLYLWEGTVLSYDEYFSLIGDTPPVLYPVNSIGGLFKLYII